MNATLKLILSIALLAIDVILIIVVMLQKSEDDGIGALSGTRTDSYYNKNRKSSLESKLSAITIIMGISAAIFCVIMVVFQ